MLGRLKLKPSHDINQGHSSECAERHSAFVSRANLISYTSGETVRLLLRVRKKALPVNCMVFIPQWEERGPRVKEGSLRCEGKVGAGVCGVSTQWYCIPPPVHQSHFLARPCLVREDLLTRHPSFCRSLYTLFIPSASLGF